MHRDLEEVPYAVAAGLLAASRLGDARQSLVLAAGETLAPKRPEGLCQHQRERAWTLLELRWMLAVSISLNAFLAEIFGIFAISLLPS